MYLGNWAIHLVDPSEMVTEGLRRRAQPSPMSKRSRTSMDPDLGSPQCFFCVVLSESPILTSPQTDELVWPVIAKRSDAISSKRGRHARDARRRTCLTAEFMRRGLGNDPQAARFSPPMFQFNLDRSVFNPRRHPQPRLQPDRARIMLPGPFLGRTQQAMPPTRLTVKMPHVTWRIF